MVRRLLDEERYADATELSKQMQGPFTQPYLCLGNMYMEFDGQEKEDYLFMRNSFSSNRGTITLFAPKKEETEPYVG